MIGGLFLPRAFQVVAWHHTPAFYSDEVPCAPWSRLSYFQSLIHHFFDSEQRLFLFRATKAGCRTPLCHMAYCVLDATLLARSINPHEWRTNDRLETLAEIKRIVTRFIDICEVWAPCLLHPGMVDSFGDRCSLEKAINSKEGMKTENPRPTVSRAPRSEAKSRFASPDHKPPAREGRIGRTNFGGIATIPRPD